MRSTKKPIIAGGPEKPDEARRVPARLKPFVILGVAFAALLALGTAPTRAAENNAQALIQRLRSGGYVLVMRHAQSPNRLPGVSEADADNPRHERQLDATGRASAQALGAALHGLRIPIGKVYSSPLYRARESVRLADLPQPQIVDELAEGKKGMASTARRQQNLWLRRAVAELPQAGTDTLIVTHTPNIVGAFGQAAAAMQAGEMLVFEPQANQAHLLGTISIAQWQAAQQASAAAQHQGRSR